ncbi:MAG: sugar phosphate isomerase/epimerase [Bacteroidetes bacterium]|nr:sugar phosphate isomerase/epimerase [Bacteroidota bacterium]
MPFAIKYICTHWGQEQLSAEKFIGKIVENGYQGIEINLPKDENFIRPFIEGVQLKMQQSASFVFVAQQLIPAQEDVEVYIKALKNRLNELISYQPTLINSHTGVDYYSFDDNCRAIEACLNISEKKNIKILHETHRGRFSFHAASLIPYLEKFPELNLTGDLSHFCVVSESLLHDQSAILQRIIPHVAYIHARVGYEQGPQVNDPFAPEWGAHLKQFEFWWNEILNYRVKKETMICPEFGPFPYMQRLPYTTQPVADQWSLNLKMKSYLKNVFE